MKKLLIKDFGVVTLLFFFCGFVNAQSSDHVLGVGHGEIYGGIGVNYEIGINEYAAGTAGLGISIELDGLFLDVATGWFVGGRLYYPINDSFRVRLNAGYGLVSEITKKAYPGWGEDTNLHTGFAVGPGFEWRYRKKWSFQADAYYVLPDNAPDDYYDPDAGVGFALGFARHF